MILFQADKLVRLLKHKLRPGMLKRYIVPDVMYDILPDVVPDIERDIASDVVVYLRCWLRY